MTADFQGELLALLNGNDEGLSSSNNNSSNRQQQQHLSRRTGGGNGLAATSKNASPPPPLVSPVPRIKNRKDKSSNLRQRLRRLRKDAFIYLTVGAISLVCILYVIRGYRIKFRIRLPSVTLRHSSSSLVSTNNEQSSTTRGGTPTAHNANNGGGYAVTSTRSNPTFIDPAWIGNDDAQYQTFLPPSDIDFSIPRRAHWVKGKDRQCDNVLLFLSPSSSHDASYTTNLTHGTYELRGYFMAAMMATYTNRALVVLDAPMDVNAEKRSWYDCEATPTTVDEMVENKDATTPISIEDQGRRRTKGNKKIDRQNNNKQQQEQRQSRPTLFNGLNHLIQHPQWLSHGCPVPCQSSYDYSKWNDVRDTNMQWEEEEEEEEQEQQHQTSNNSIGQQQHQVTCHNDNNRQATVFIVGLDDIFQHFTYLWITQISIRPNYNDAHQWAINLGAKGHEAHTFASLEHSNDIWDYATALMARSGMIRFQPSFALEIKTRIKSSPLPLNWPYTAISTYRGILSGENEEATTTTSSSNKRPRELLTYFQQLERVQCKISNSRKEGSSNVVYIATDDPSWVQDEIDVFLRGSSPNCRNVQFILSNNNNNDVSAMIKQGDDYCTQLHREKVNVMADLMILAKSETYVGGGIGEKGWMDMSSDNVAWLVRTVRTLVGSPSVANTCYDG